MNHKSITLFLLLTFLVACGKTTQPTAPPETAIPSPTLEPTPVVKPTAAPGTLYVDPAIELGPISPYIFGTNYGPMHAILPDMLPYAMNAGITALRWPGGAWGDVVDIQTFQIDTFIEFCNQMGALPTISVRLLGGTPETAANLVRYTNIEKKYGVVYWSIGNEPTLYAENTGETYDTVRFNQEWRAIAEAMKAVDPTIQLMGPELHQWGTSLATTLKDSSGRDWMTEFLKTNGDLVDVVTVHRYPLWKSGGQSVTIQELRQNTNEWPALVIYLRSLIQEITGRDIPIAFTEVNSDPRSVIAGKATPDSFYNAIWYADVLGHLIQQQVFMVNQWVISQRESGLSLISGTEIRPTYYTFLMYKNFGSELIYASSGMSDLNVYAAKREDGTLTVMIVNLADNEQRPTVQIRGVTPGDAQVWLLDSTHHAEDMGMQAMPANGVLTLPGQSVILYIIPQEHKIEDD
jgi:hypothetical protein